jgi:hypothetical protein
MKLVSSKVVRIVILDAVLLLRSLFDAIPVLNSFRIFLLNSSKAYFELNLSLDNLSGLVLTCPLIHPFNDSIRVDSTHMYNIRRLFANAHQLCPLLLIYLQYEYDHHNI